MITLPPSDYSFCERATATAASKWHIRRLTITGKKLGGGADTAAMCGRTVAWDSKVSQATRDSICPDCLKAFDIEFKSRRKPDMMMERISLLMASISLILSIIAFVIAVASTIYVWSL
jgi:hypothetical protein